MDPDTPTLLQAREKAGARGYHRLTLRTTRGPIEARYSPAAGARCAALLVGGVGGGFDSPARDLYGRLAAELPSAGIACLRVRYRNSTDLDEAIHDVRAGVRFLLDEGVARVGLVGHSFGGAVVVSAAAAQPEVATVLTLSTQAYGTDDVDDLAPRPLLLIHGAADEVLPSACSTMTWRRAGEPKELRILEGARHVLDEAAEEVHEAVRAWLARHLPPP